MQNGITMGQYLPTGSALHQMDPRSKLMALAFLGPAALMTSCWWMVLGISILLLLCLILTHIRPSIYWQSLKLVWILLGISALLQLLFTPGITLWSWGWFKITHQGLMSGSMFLWRLTVLLLLTQVLTFTTTPLQLTKGLEWVLAPLTKLRLPVRELAMMVNLALKFVPTLFNEARLLLLAQRARGVDFTKGSIKKRMQGLIPFLVPLLTNIFRQADLQALALEVRGYTVGHVRSSMHIMRFSLVDYVAVGITLMMLLLVLGQLLT